MYKISSVTVLASIAILSAFGLITPAVSIDKPEIAYTSENIAVPHKIYPLLYTLHARKGLLMKDKQGIYKLSLREIDKNVIYQFAMPTRPSGLTKLNEFIELWQSKHPAVVEADVTGLQQDNKTVGHNQVYIRANLSDLQSANLAQNSIIVTLSALNPPLQVVKTTMQNVTVFINGCSICTCTADQIKCEK